MLASQALLYLYVGRWSDAATVGSQVLQRPGASAINRIPALVALGRLRARRGEPEAHTVLNEALDLAIPTGNLQHLGLVRAARAEVAWLTGDPKRAGEEARAVYDLAVSKEDPWLTGELAFWRWRAGDDVTLPPWTAQPFALQIGGAWHAAADAWHRLGWPYEQGRALADGDDDAQTTALSMFERLGARLTADGLRRTMRAQGLTAIPRGPRPSTRENRFGLTGRQVEILSLLTTDLSDAEIAARLHLSTKTVGHHVTAVLTKMDVPSRKAAATLARQQRILQPT